MGKGPKQKLLQLPPESRVFMDHLNSYGISRNLPILPGLCSPNATTERCWGKKPFRGRTVAKTQTAADQHWEGGNGSELSLCCCGGWGSTQLHSSLVQRTSAYASIATGCCSGGTPCGLILTLF